MSGTEMLLRLAMLNNAYVSTLDADRLEAWPDFFCEDCVYKITTAENHRRGLQAGVIYADTRAMLHDRVLALRKANIYERHAYRHIVGMPTILSQDADRLEAETSFLVVRTMRDGKMDIFVVGRYADKLRQEADGTLRFAERLAICDSPRFDTLLAIPL